MQEEEAKAMLDSFVASFAGMTYRVIMLLANLTIIEKKAPAFVSTGGVTETKPVPTLPSLSTQPALSGLAAVKKKFENSTPPRIVFFSYNCNNPFTFLILCSSIVSRKE